MAQSLDHIRIEETLWNQFAVEAKHVKKDPAQLLTGLLRGYLDQQARERLNQATVEAMKTTLTEDDDIEGIIKELRGKDAANKEGRFSESAVPFARQLVSQNQELFETLARR